MWFRSLLGHCLPGSNFIATRRAHHWIVCCIAITRGFLFLHTMETTIMSCCAVLKACMGYEFSATPPVPAYVIPNRVKTPHFVETFSQTPSPNSYSLIQPVCNLFIWNKLIDWLIYVVLLVVVNDFVRSHHDLFIYLFIYYKIVHWVQYKI